MKTFLVISALSTCLWYNTTAQPLKNQFAAESDPEEEQPVSVKPTKTRLKAGQLAQWRVDLTDPQSQFLHIRVRQGFRLTSLLPVLTPFAITRIGANYGRQSVTQPDNQLISDHGLPITVSAGVLAGTGILASTRWQSESRLLITYYDQQGKAMRSITRPIPNGREIIVPMNYCGGPKEARIGLVGPTKGQVKISMNSQATALFSVRGGVGLNDEDNPCDDSNGDPASGDDDGDEGDGDGDGGDGGNGDDGSTMTPYGAPSNPTAGTAYTSPYTGQSYIYDGSSWVITLSAVDIPGNPPSNPYNGQTYTYTDFSNNITTLFTYDNSAGWTAPMSDLPRPKPVYTDEPLCRTLNRMWAASLRNNQPYMEVMALITNQGTLILPTAGLDCAGVFHANTTTGSYSDYLGSFITVQDGNGNISQQLELCDGTRVEVYGAIHTHPSTAIGNPFQPSPRDMMWADHHDGIINYILGADGLLKFDADGNTTPSLSSQDLANCQ